MRRGILFLLFLQQAFFVYSQTNSWLTAEPPLRVQPSPTAFSITAQSSETVDLYTGKVNVSIPLYTLRSRDIELPIGLTYNSSGVRVDDIASWVGNSWSLQAGGCISRVMRNLPDEFLGKAIPLRYRENYPTGEGIDGFGYLQLKGKGILLSDFLSQSNSQKNKIINNADWMSLDGKNYGDGLGFGEAWDTEPDEFHFNFGKYSGYFVFDQDGEMQFVSHQNFRSFKTIKQIVAEDGRSYPMIVSFTIYTDDGYKYTFGDDALATVETTKTVATRQTFSYNYKAVRKEDGSLVTYDPDVDESDQNDDHPIGRLWETLPRINGSFVNNEILPTGQNVQTISFFTSCWYLKEVESPSGDKIFFNYSKPADPLNYSQTQGVRKKLSDRDLGQITVDSTTKSQVPPGTYFITTTDDDSPGDFSNEISLLKNFVMIDNRLLSSIVSSSGGYVKFFTEESQREDLLNDHALKLISVYDDVNTNIKTFKFQYSYQVPSNFTGPQGYFIGSLVVDGVVKPYYAVEDVPQAVLQSEQKRLFLQKIFEYRDDASVSPIIPPYEFLYDTQVLPRRGFLKDAWGFYESGVQAGILKKIYYPTSGAKEFVYERNQISTGTTGGIRIKEIRVYPDPQSQSYNVLQSYSYENGSIVKPVVYNYALYINSAGKKDYFYSSDPVNHTYLTHGGVVGYKTVKVYQIGIGKTIYTFKTPADELNQQPTIGNTNATFDDKNITATGDDMYPYPPDRDNDWRRGLAGEVKITLENESQVLKKQTNGYRLDTNDEMNWVFVYGITPGVYFFNKQKMYRFGVYRYVSAWPYLKTEIITEYNSVEPGNEAKALTVTNTYEYGVRQYENRQYAFLKSKTTDALETGVFKTEFRYPLDVDSYNSTTLPLDPVGNALLKMSRSTENKHMLSYPIETIKYRDGVVVESLIQTYKGFPDLSSSIRPYQNFLLEIRSPIKAEDPVPYKYFNIRSGLPNPVDKDTRAVLRNTVTLYDDVGNVQEYRTIEGVVVTVLYGYRQRYPVAEIRNATYQDVVNVLGQGVITQLNTNAGSDDQLLSKLQPLRTAASLAKAVITTYTYQPLVGMTSMTDPTELRYYYEYDALNRLKTISVRASNETNKSIVKCFDYNYQFK